MGGIGDGSDEVDEQTRDHAGGRDAARSSDVPTGPVRPRPGPGNTGETTPRPGPAPDTNQLSYWQQAAAGPDDRTSQFNTGYGGYGGYADPPPPPPPPPQIEPTQFGMPTPPWAEPERPRRDSSNLALWVALAALLVVVAGGIVVVTVLHSSSKSSAAQPTTSGSPSTSAPSASPSATATSAAIPSASGRGIAGGDSGGATAAGTGVDPAGAETGMSTANQIDALLDQSSAARAGVRPSLDAIRHCEADGTTITTLQSAGDTRQSLLTQLDSFRFDLLTNGAMLRTQLSQLLTYSYEADDAYAAWGTDNLGCQDLAPYDAQHSAGDAYSAQATAAKQRFLRWWNPVASQYGLQLRTESTI